MPQDVKMNLWTISRSFSSKYDFLDDLNKKKYTGFYMMETLIVKGIKVH